MTAATRYLEPDAQGLYTYALIHPLDVDVAVEHTDPGEPIPWLIVTEDRVPGEVVFVQSSRPYPTSTVTITLDPTAFLAGVGRALAQIGTAATASVRALVEAFMPALGETARQINALLEETGWLEVARRQNAGPHQMTADGDWQSSACATWLHDDCPACELCHCTCHPGGRLW